MLIKLTEPGTKTEMYFSAEQVRCVMPVPGNPMICQVVTNWLTPQGFQSLEALGSADTIAREINAALSGKNLLVQ